MVPDPFRNGGILVFSRIRISGAGLLRPDFFKELLLFQPGAPGVALLRIAFR
jgi:hypothetical protein